MSRPSDRQRHLQALTATDAAEAACWYARQGAYRIASVLLQLAGAIEASEPDPGLDMGPKCGHGYWADGQACPHGCSTLAEDTQPVPILRLPMRDEHPRTTQAVSGHAHGQGPTGDGDADLAATAVLEQPQSHAPTTCVHPVRSTFDGAPGQPCGELIRWTSGDVPGMPHGGWFHVNDGRLGRMDHPATPGQ
jgi:hypothetical protein